MTNEPEESAACPPVVDATWGRTNFFEVLGDPSNLLQGRPCWVMLRDGLAEICLVGSWQVTSRGQLDTRRLASRADLGRSDFGKDGVLVFGFREMLCLQQVQASKAELRITDGYLLELRTPSEHPDNRPDLRIRRG